MCGAREKYKGRDDDHRWEETDEQEKGDGESAFHLRAIKEKVLITSVKRKFFSH